MKKVEFILSSKKIVQGFFLLIIGVQFDDSMLFGQVRWAVFFWRCWYIFSGKDCSALISLT